MGASRLGRTRAAFASSVLWVVIIMSLCELLPLVDATKKQPSAVAVGAAAAVGAVATVAATAVVGATSAALVTVVGNSGTLTFAAAAAVTVVGGLGLASAMKSLDLRALSKGLQGKSSADGTNKGYTSSRRVLAAWARVHCPDILGEDGLVKASKIIAGAQFFHKEGDVEFANETKLISYWLAARTLKADGSKASTSTAKTAPCMVASCPRQMHGTCMPLGEEGFGSVNNVCALYMYTQHPATCKCYL